MILVRGRPCHSFRSGHDRMTRRLGDPTPGTRRSSLPPKRTEQLTLEAMAVRRAAVIASRLLQHHPQAQQLRHSAADAAQTEAVLRDGAYASTSGRSCDNALHIASTSAVPKDFPPRSATVSQPSIATAAKAAVSFYKRQLPRDVVAFASPEVSAEKKCETTPHIVRQVGGRLLTRPPTKAVPAHGISREGSFSRRLSTMAV